MARDDFKFIVDEDGGSIAGFFELASKRLLKKSVSLPAPFPRIDTAVDEPDGGEVARDVGDFWAESEAEAGLAVSSVATISTVTRAVAAVEIAGVDRLGRGVVPALAVFSFVGTHERVAWCSPSEIDGVWRHAAGDFAAFYQRPVFGVECFIHLRFRLNASLWSGRGTGHKQDGGEKCGDECFHKTREFKGISSEINPKIFKNAERDLPSSKRKQHSRPGKFSASIHLSRIKTCQNF